MTPKNELVRTFSLGTGNQGSLISLPAFERAISKDLSRLPVCLRIILESLIRNFDETIIPEKAIYSLASWKPNAPRTEEIPFVVSRVLLQDFTGVPLLVDLAAMRSCLQRLGKDPELIEPLVPVDLIIDHSVQMDYVGSPDALSKNMELELTRNIERYQFLKWGMQAFKTFKVIPPGVGIIHQINLEFIATGIRKSPDNIWFPDTLVGTDSHTTMINGLGIVAWGVGGIEAEAAMLGQPIYFLTPDVVGVYLHGKPADTVTPTDIALSVTQLLRREKVVGKFVEFFGPGAKSMPVVDRAVIANMAPEYGATMGFFPIDEESVKFLRQTGRPEELCLAYESYYRAQNLFGIPEKGQVDYSKVIDLDLSAVEPSAAGPKRPQDRVSINKLKDTFTTTLTAPLSENGFAKTDINKKVTINLGQNKSCELSHGSVLIASITSCTNTSTPSLMIAAGLLARNAIDKGLSINPAVKASLAPGSRAVTTYLKQAGLMEPLEKLGFYVCGYGCATCIGNSGPINPSLEEAIINNDIIAVAVLSGNRNFEARIHPSIKANYLMSPPLVVAYALAGKIDFNPETDPLRYDRSNKPVYLKDIWPDKQEILKIAEKTLNPQTFKDIYSNISEINPSWKSINSPTGNIYKWNPSSTYIQEPPFFENFELRPQPLKDIIDARILGIFGDSVTTDHISPAGSIKESSPAGQYLISLGVKPSEFNSFGARRGNDRVMTRGTFSNIRLKNYIGSGYEGGKTLLQPDGLEMSIFDAAQIYAKRKTPLVVFAGYEYGTGSSRDWAAKGTALLGVKAVIAKSFERIHRSNLIGMGVLPIQLPESVSVKSLGLTGNETINILGIKNNLTPLCKLSLVIKKPNTEPITCEAICRIDTPIEVEYYKNGGILPYVLRKILST